MKILKFGTKNASFVCFWEGIWKFPFHILNQGSGICGTRDFHPKQKIKKQKTTTLDQKSSIQVFGMGSWKTIAIFLIYTFQYVWKHGFVQKLKFLNLELKMSYFRVLGNNFEKPLSYLQSAYSNLSYCKAWCKEWKFGTKNVSFEWFWAAIRK